MKPKLIAPHFRIQTSDRENSKVTEEVSSHMKADVKPGFPRLHMTWLTIKQVHSDRIYCGTSIYLYNLKVSILLHATKRRLSLKALTYLNKDRSPWLLTVY